MERDPFNSAERFKLKPGEEEFGAPKKVTNPEQFQQFHRTSVQPNGDPFPPKTGPGGINELRDQVIGGQEAREEASARAAYKRDVRYENQQEARAYKAGRNRQTVNQDDPKLQEINRQGHQDQQHEDSVDRRFAFAYGLTEVAQHLRSLHRHQPDLLSIARRRY